MVVIERSLLLRLTRELRNANGIERTPSQVEKWVGEHAKRPATFVKNVLADADAILTMAERMRIPYIENAPPSSDWE